MHFIQQIKQNKVFFTTASFKDLIAPRTTVLLPRGQFFPVRGLGAADPAPTVAPETQTPSATALLVPLCERGTVFFRVVKTLPLFKEEVPEGGRS